MYCRAFKFSRTEGVVQNDFQQFNVCVCVGGGGGRHNEINFYSVQRGRRKTFRTTHFPIL